MSIEWLLVKNKDSEEKQKNSPRAQQEGKDDQKSELDENLSGFDARNFPSEIELRCSCGYEGIVSKSKSDFKFLRQDKKSCIYFECSNCKRHLKYDCSTGKVKIKKGILGVLPLRSK